MNDYQDLAAREMLRRSAGTPIHLTSVGTQRTISGILVEASSTCSAFLEQGLEEFLRDAPDLTRGHRAICEVRGHLAILRFITRIVPVNAHEVTFAFPDRIQMVRTRSFPRLTVALETFILPVQRYGIGHSTIDISLSGLALRPQMELELQHEYDLRFGSPGWQELGVLRSKAVRVEPTPEGSVWGLQFAPLDFARKIKLANLIFNVWNEVDAQRLAAFRRAQETLMQERKVR